MAKKNPTKDSEHESLAKELRGYIPQLDTEGLAWLVDQAKIHLYNMRVDEHNEAVLAAAESAAADASKAGKKSGAGKTGAANKPAGFSIRGTESGSSFYLHYRNDDIMFSKAEMIRLVKIVNGPGTDLEIRERLYNWFDRERKDIFALANMKDKFDDRLKDLSAVIKKNIKLTK